MVFYFLVIEPDEICKWAAIRRAIETNSKLFLALYVRDRKINDHKNDSN